MSILKCFSVFDTKSKAFSKPVYCITRGVVIRSITEELKNADSDYAKYPSDFTLFEVGEWDDSTGMFTSKTPESLGSLVEFMNTIER